MSKKMTIELVKQLADEIMINITDVEAEKIVATETNLLSAFEKIKAIDTNGIEPQHFIFETPSTFLRDDNVSNVLEQEIVLKNAPSTDGDFVTINKVVK